MLAACSPAIRPRLLQNFPGLNPTQTPTSIGPSRSTLEKPVPVTSTGQLYPVMIVDDEFQPGDLSIPAGSTVVWMNMGQHRHSVTADDGSFASDALENGATFQFTFTQEGIYIYHCTFHGGTGGQGMTGAVTVYAGAPPSAAETPAAPVDPAPVVIQPGETRVFDIGAVEVEWDYAPTNLNQITGQPFTDQANVFVQHGDTFIGKVYTKAVYREFTDQTFTTQKSILPQWQHLGILGPVIHAEVGDTIVVHFKNLTSRPVSMHPHGVFYNKNSEGASYNDGTSGDDKADDGVPPGGTHTYTWQVPERAGPGPMDPALGDVDVPLPRGRTRRHQRRVDGGDHHHRPGKS